MTADAIRMVGVRKKPGEPLGLTVSDYSHKLYSIQRTLTFQTIVILNEKKIVFRKRLENISIKHSNQCLLNHDVVTNYDRFNSVRLNSS